MLFHKHGGYFSGVVFIVRLVGCGVSSFECLALRAAAARRCVGRLLPSLDLRVWWQRVAASLVMCTCRLYE